jgi:GAF domain-containing protein
MTHHLSLPERALDEAIAGLGADSGTIHLRDPNNGALGLAASRGINEQVLKAVRAVPWGKGMAGAAAERAAPVTFSNIQTSPSPDIHPRARQSGTRGAIVVPMFHGHEVIGTIGIGCNRERVFTAAEIAWLLRLGRKLADELGEHRLAA